MKKEVFRLYGSTRFDIVVTQTAVDEFTVTYGLEGRDQPMDYSRACARLGACIMHAQTLEGKIVTPDFGADNG